MEILKSKGRGSFGEAYRAHADANNSQGQIIKIQQLFFP
jgi:hypothetical protein